MDYLRLFIGKSSYVLVWLIVFMIPPTSKYGIYLVRWHLPFFMAGYLIFKYQARLKKYKNLILSLCLVLFPILVFSWHRSTLPAIFTSLRFRMNLKGLLNQPLGESFSVNLYQIIVTAYSYLVPFTAIGFIYKVMNLHFVRKTHKILNYFGLHTIEVYAIFWYFLRFGFGGFWINTIRTFIISTTLSLLIGTLLLRRFDLLNQLFLGGRTAPKVLAKSRLKS